MSGVWWWFLLSGIVWTLFGMFVLSYRVGSVAAVAVFVGVAFLFGGVTLLAFATSIPGLAVDVHRGGDLSGDRWDHDLRLAGYHVLRRVGLRRLVLIVFGVMHSSTRSPAPSWGGGGRSCYSGSPSSSSVCGRCVPGNGHCSRW